MNVFKICSKVNAFRQSIDNQLIRLLRFFIRNEKVVGSSPTRGSICKRLSIRLLRLIDNLLHYEIVALLGL